MKAIEKFRKLVGLEKIKVQFEKYLTSVRYSREHGSYFLGHMALVGNPGTGKTTVARLFCDILHEEGILPKGQFIQVSCHDLFGTFAGQTKAKTQVFCESAKGGVLCIDEAYGLLAENAKGYDFGLEAIEVLLEFMTSKEAADTIIILTGYKREMIDFLGSANPGLKSRIPWVFVFEDYTDDELTKLFQIRLDAEHMVLGTDALAFVRDYFASLPRNKNFGNGIEIDVLYSKVKTKQFSRLQELTNPSEEDFSTILLQDFPPIKQGVVLSARSEADLCDPVKFKSEVSQIINELQYGLQQLQSKLNEFCNE